MFDPSIFEVEDAFTDGATGMVRKCQSRAELSEWFAGFSMACGQLIPAAETPMEPVA